MCASQQALIDFLRLVAGQVIILLTPSNQPFSVIVISVSEKFVKSMRNDYVTASPVVLDGVDILEQSALNHRTCQTSQHTRF